MLAGVRDRGGKAEELFDAEGRYQTTGGCLDGGNRTQHGLEAGRYRRQRRRAGAARRLNLGVERSDLGFRLSRREGRALEACAELVTTAGTGGTHLIGEALGLRVEGAQIRLRERELRAEIGNVGGDVYAQCIGH